MPHVIIANFSSDEAAANFLRSVLNPPASPTSNPDVFAGMSRLANHEDDLIEEIVRNGQGVVTPPPAVPAPTGPELGSPPASNNF